MRRIFETVKKITDYKTTTLITGESGTGKELIARAIHYNGTRKNAPMVAVNCGGLPENLLESELFGYVKGAFTDAVHNKAGLFQEANGGTLFLDEIGDLPLPLQVKLLRVLQDEIIRPLGSNDSVKVDVRIIAATAVDLAQRVKEATFRDDLFYRINVLNIHIPPLRERKEDIPLLVDFFIRKHNERMKKNIQGFSPEALQLLICSPWPGNVRELENIIERIMVLTENKIIQKQELPIESSEQQVCSGSNADSGGLEMPDSSQTISGFSIRYNTACLEKRLIEQALKQTCGNRTQAAKLLEISHPTLLSKMKTYDLS
jgi:two-component system response regulator AtoC